MELTSGIVCMLDSYKRPAGTGFVVSAATENLIITCAHVLGEPRPERVTIVFQATAEQREAKLVEQWWRSESTEDVAVLQVVGDLSEQVQPFLLGTAAGTRGHTIHTFGFPNVGEVEGVLGTGEVLGLGAKTKAGQPLLQVRSTEITSGFSGAPLWDEARQRVVGMVVIVAKPDASGKLSETAFAIPTETLQMVCPILRVSELCPYRGLDAFTEGHAEFFFGREHIIDKLINRLKQDIRFLAVLGPSGSGKSSVVQAGLIPQLRHGAIGDSDHWELIVTRPADNPFKQLAAKGFAVELQDLTVSVRAWLTQHPKRTRLVLVFDQFEELLTACPEALRQEFVAQLTSLLAAPLPITIVIVMRDDFYNQFARQETLVEWLERSQGPVNVPQTLTLAEVTAIVQKPAEAVGLRFEDGLVEIIVKDAMEAAVLPTDERRVTRSSNLPLLEFTLTQLWERRENGMLMRNAYISIGGVTGGLTQWADRVFYGLENEEKQRKARRIFTDLVHIGDESQGLPDSRIRMSLDLLCREEREIEEVHQVVQQLASARLLVTSYNIQSKQETVEIIHDALLLEWGLLKQWLQEDRSFLVWHQELKREVQEWVETNADRPAKREKDKLLRGSDLIKAKVWMKGRSVDLSQVEQDFIRASRNVKQRRVVVGSLSLGMLALAAGGGYEFYQSIHPPPSSPVSGQFNVYTDVNALGNHYMPTGFMGDYGAIKLTENWGENPHSGNTCIRVDYNGIAQQSNNWAGVYWQDPPNNWGWSLGQTGYNLSKHSLLSFWVRGDKGNEHIQFFVGGITGFYGDSLQPALYAESGGTNLITLTTSWQRVLINLKGQDLTHIIGGFGFSTNHDVNSPGATFYLDDIIYT